MAKTPETLDEKLRERARKKLMTELNEAAQPLRNELRPLNPCYTEVEGENQPCTTLVNQIVKAIYDLKIEKAEREEIEGFMKQVEELQEQIDELHQGL